MGKPLKKNFLMHLLFKVDSLANGLLNSTIPLLSPFVYYRKLVGRSWPRTILSIPFVLH